MKDVNDMNMSLLVLRKKIISMSSLRKT
ncbi:hypothetical protein SPV_2510 [Streptococcus pneumoniae]|nr:hypothetical protein SPV_2510 [Streptococcus pneumoniae]